MAYKLEVELIGDNDRLSRTFRGSVRDADTFGSRMRRVGGIAATTFGAIGVGVGAAAIGVKHLSDDASDLGEQMNKTRVVFRGSEKDVLRWSKSTGAALGISRREALEAAGVFGNMLVPMGVARERAGEMSTSMVELAADMASFNNADPTEVLEALRAGLAGETEPLRRFGVFLSAARLEQEALNKGLGEGYDDLTSAQKAQLTYGVILKDTTDAQGDFTRTRESQANQERIMRAQLEDTSAAFGNIFLPVVNEATRTLASDLLPQLERTGDSLARIAGRDDIDLGKKLALGGGVIKKQWGAVPGEIGEVVQDAIPIIAHHLGQGGVVGARAFAEGFVEADVWGKLAIGGLLFAKFGGIGGFSKFGGKAGSKFAGAFLLAVLGSELAKEIKGIIEGEKVDQTDREAAAVNIRDAWNGRVVAEQLQTSALKFKGSDKISVDTALGDLVFDAATEKVVAARGRRLRQFIGKELQAVIPAYKSEISKVQSSQRGGLAGSGDDPWGIANSMSKSWRKAGGVTREGLADISRQLDMLPPDAARASGQLMLQIVRQMRQKGQLPKGEAEKIRSAVVNKLDAMARQGGRKGQLLSQSVGGAFGGMSTTSGEALEVMGTNLEDMLENLGASEIPRFNVQYKGFGNKGKGFLDLLPELGEARGALKTVPGTGLQDSVPLSVNGGLSAVVAPGETLATINRHQYPLLDRAVTNEYGVAGLPGFFNAFDRPHYMARGGFPEIGVAGRGPLATAANRTTHQAYLQMRKYLREHMGPARVIQNIDRMDALRRPYLWGGGHGAVADVDGPWDCSGGVTEALDGGGIPTSPMVSGEFMHWGQPGKGPVTVLANPEHMYMVVQTPKGWRAAGTSGENPGGGFGWIDGYTFRGGFAVRHVDAGGAAKLIRRGGGGRGKGQERKKGFAGGGEVVKGTATWFNGGATAGGSNTSQPGLALNLNAGTDSGWNNDTTQGWMEASREGHPVFAQVSIGGKSAKLPITDLGPAGWTGHSIDVTEGGVAKLGFTTSNFPSGTVGVAKILGEGGKAEPPASKQQRGTLGRLRKRAGRLVGEIRKLEREYEKHGGTKRGKRALQRALKFARQAARKVKAGSREEAEKLIDKARDAIGDSRSSLEQASENVFTPGMRGGTLPPLAAGAFDASQEFSTSNLPGLDALPTAVQKQLRSPGLTATGKYGVLETALSDAGLTDTRADDAAALNAMLGMSRQRRARLKKRLDDLNARLKKGGLTKKQRENLVKQRDSVLSALGEVSGNIGSIREQIGGLNEESEADDALQEAIEANTQAMEEHTSALQENAKAINAQVEFAKSATATSSATAWTALADILSGRLGGTAQLAAATAGNGSPGTLNRF